jgi:Na+-transporting methylmalonyl-CoA/oxaloacetate decarboxylase gamma subunit
MSETPTKTKPSRRFLFLSIVAAVVALFGVAVAVFYAEAGSAKDALETTAPANP